jgi:hypothetical protein
MANPHTRLFQAFSIRYLVLLPIAFCLYVLIISDDMNMRFLAVIALVVLAQVRDITLMSAAQGLAKGNKS